MGEVILVRHGQASFGAANYDKLSDLGHQQAEWLGHYFAEHAIAFDHAVCGSLQRHQETLAGINRSHHLPATETDARFNELDYDALQSQYIRATGVDAPVDRRAFTEHFPEIFERWEAGELGKDAESFTDFRSRVEIGLDAVAEPGRSILIVTSGGVIGVLLRRILGLSARATADLMLNIHNASVHRLTLEYDVLRLSLFNASPHLEGEARAHARTFI